MVNTKEDILDILKKQMTDESTLLFSTLIKQNEPIAKEELWKLANSNKKSTDPKKEFIINSRYTLDINTARLEGAGLINVKSYGRIRTYSISPLGKEFYNYLRNK